MLLPDCGCCGGCDLVATAAEYAAKTLTIDITENTVARDASTTVGVFQWAYSASPAEPVTAWVRLSNGGTFASFPESPNPTATCYEPGDRVSGSHVLDYNAALSVATSNGRDVVFRKIGPSYQITAYLSLSTSITSGFESRTFPIGSGCFATLRLSVVAWDYESTHTASEIGLSPSSGNGIQTISAVCDSWKRQDWRIATYVFGSVPYWLYYNDNASNVGGNYGVWSPSGNTRFDGAGYFDTSKRPTGAGRNRGETYIGPTFYLPTVGSSGAISGTTSGTYVRYQWLSETPAADATSGLAENVSISGESWPAANSSDGACDSQIPKSEYTKTNYKLKRTTPAFTMSATAVFT